MPSPSSDRDVAAAPSLLALTPLLLFIALFCGVGFALTYQGVPQAFYQLPAAVALVPALALALWLSQRRGSPALDRLLGGMGDKDVQLMLLIFLLSGAFTAVSRATGGVEAVVAIGLSVIPAALILPGIFLLAVAIALALGTTMRAKFFENLKFAVPAAIGTVVLLAFAGDAQPVPPSDPPSAWLALPYLAVLLLALLGLNVLIVLALGVVLAGAFGLAFAGYGLLGFGGDVHKGFLSVTDTVLVSLFVAGLGALIRADGGFAWFVERIEHLARGRKGPRVGQLGIAALVSGSDALLANNTVAILLTGPIAKDIAAEHGVSPARSASLLDIFACVTQSLLPWGAQILLAASLGDVSPLALAGSLHYCWLLGGLTLAWVLLERRRSGSTIRAGAGAPAGTSPATPY